jgi:hypothetical protein
VSLGERQLTWLSSQTRQLLSVDMRHTASGPLLTLKNGPLPTEQQDFKIYFGFRASTEVAPLQHRMSSCFWDEAAHKRSILVGRPRVAILPGRTRFALNCPACADWMFGMQHAGRAINIVTRWLFTAPKCWPGLSAHVGPFKAKGRPGTIVKDASYCLKHPRGTHKRELSPEVPAMRRAVVGPQIAR